MSPRHDSGETFTVMVCEDEPIVALDLKFLVEGFGYRVLGPFGSVEKGLAALEAELPDAAILDVRLRDGEVFPIAERLRDAGVGLVFHSGHYYDEEIGERFPDALCCQKPIATWKLEQALERVAEASATQTSDARLG